MNEDELYALREALAHRDRLISRSPLVIFQYDPQTFQLDYISPNIDRILGYSPEEAKDVFDSWPEFVHPEDRADALESRQPVAERRQRQSQHEYRIRHKDGTYRRARIVIEREYDEQGEPAEHIGYGLDITEQKREVDQRTALEREQARLEGASLTGRAAVHEINQGLTSIIGRAEILRQRVQSTDPQLAEQLDLIRQAGLRLAEQARRFLQISRVVIEDVPGVGAVLDIAASSAQPPDTDA